MKLRTCIAATAGLMLTCGVAKAVHIWEDPGGWWSSAVTYDTSVPLYTANELSLDLSGSYIAHEGEFENIFKTSIKGDRGRWGGNVGLNYFFTRNIGIGGDFNIAANGGEALDQALGSVIFRFPIDPTGLAPYIFGGGGRQFDALPAATDSGAPSWDWLGHAGVGLEYRFNPVLGMFADGRFIWAEHEINNKMLLRAGFRIVF